MPRTPPDPYAVLGVRRGATQQELAWAYRRLARRHHPDRSPGPGATDHMRRINAAWRTLSDPLERAKLDRAAAAAPKAWSAAPDHRTAGQRRAGPAGWQRQA